MVAHVVPVPGPEPWMERRKGKGKGKGKGKVDLITKLNSFDMIMIWILIWIVISIHPSIQPSMIGSIRPKYRRGMKVCSFRHVRFKWMDSVWTMDGLCKSIKDKDGVAIS